MMIERAAFANYRALREAEVGLAPLTALVGPNASGKSSVLRALDLGTSLDMRDVWWHEPTKATLRVALDVQGRQPIVRTVSSDVGPRLQVQCLRLDPARLKLPVKVVADHAVAGDGSNLPNVYATLSKSDRAAVTEQFRELVPVFGDVDVRPSVQAGCHGFVFEDRWSERVAYDADQVSDGTMLMLAYLIVAFQHPAVDVVTVEEPERGLHPYLLEQLIALFRTMTVGLSDRPPIQVVLATHSADVLNYLRPEEVRFMDRSSADGSVSIRPPPTTSPEWEHAFKEYREQMGEAWLSGALGGVPGS